ncbi:hypothetical protein R3Q06_36075 [Rhodococcus erythropolis]|uniref:hypothetical protein n=1 Tax=Rhodococcus erythropolis TaxID=1833 RepID=UPI0029495895|nr:hypothetical protein [Rhodococcus erythropolis]MDV6278786.1 hypothetical protein [Rhodococcus erythropolis]
MTGFRAKASGLTPVPFRPAWIGSERKRMLPCRSTARHTYFRPPRMVSVLDPDDITPNPANKLLGHPW